MQYEQEKEKLEQKRHEAQKTEAKLNLGHEIDSIVKAAEKMAGPSDGRPKAERLSGIRQNRKEEREAIRRQEAFTPKEKDSGHPQPQEAEEISPVLQMIKQKMEERIKDESLYGEGALSGTSDPGIPGEPSD